MKTVFGNIFVFILSLTTIILIDRVASRMFFEVHTDLARVSPLPCDGDVWRIEAGNVARLYRLPRYKEKGVFRIFVFGGSSTWGLPYGAAGSFSYYLKRLLENGGLGRRIELINLGLPSKAYIEVYQEIKEALRFEPDLLIVYSGHNEFLMHNVNVRNAILAKDKRIWWIKDYLHSNSAAYQFLLQLYRRYLQPKVVLDDQSPPVQIDAVRGQVHDFYLQMLSRTVDLVSANHVPLVYITPISNTVDWHPMAHLNGDPGLLERIKQTSLLEDLRQIDDEYRPEILKSAVLSFALGSQFRAAGEKELGGFFLNAAIELDNPILRMPPSLRKTALALMQKLQDQHSDLIVIDPLPELEKRYKSIGFNLILDGMHPSLVGHFEIARIAYRTLALSGRYPELSVLIPQVKEAHKFSASCLRRDEIATVAYYLLGLHDYGQQAKAYFLEAIQDNPDAQPGGETSSRAFGYLAAEYFDSLISKRQPEAPTRILALLDSVPLESFKARFTSCCFKTDQEWNDFLSWVQQEIATKRPHFQISR